MRYLFMVSLLLLAMGCGADVDYGIDTSKEFDTSESNRRAITDKMIENGSDPTEAEAFTSELFKAQREWENNK